MHYGDAQEFGEILKDVVCGEGGVALVCVWMTQAEGVLQQQLVPPTGRCAKEAKEGGMSNNLPISTKKTKKNTKTVGFFGLSAPSLKKKKSI